MARKNDDACGNPKLIRTDVDCRVARPKFNEGAWSPAKISDVTGGGLYLFDTPDESRPSTLPLSSGGSRAEVVHIEARRTRNLADVVALQVPAGGPSGALACTFGTPSKIIRRSWCR